MPYNRVFKKIILLPFTTTGSPNSMTVPLTNCNEGLFERPQDLSKVIVNFLKFKRG
jgi:hypothetical protein